MILFHISKFSTRFISSWDTFRFYLRSRVHCTRKQVLSIVKSGNTEAVWHSTFNADFCWIYKTVKESSGNTGRDLQSYHLVHVVWFTKNIAKVGNTKNWGTKIASLITQSHHYYAIQYNAILIPNLTRYWEVIYSAQPLSRTYVIKTQHNNNAMLIPNLTR